jgi:DNA-directed RNA polymerase subunit RPC12/RpoP
MKKTIQIEDDSDCETCTKRHTDNWERLLAERVKVLEGVSCPECGRSFGLLVSLDEPLD